MKRIVSICSVLVLTACSSTGMNGFSGSSFGSGSSSGTGSGSITGTGSSLGSASGLGASSGSGSGSGTGADSGSASGSGSTIQPSANNNYATSISGAPAPLFDPFLYSGGE